RRRGGNTKEDSMVTRIVTALLLGTVLLSPGLAAAEEPRSLEQIVVEMAKPRPAHAALGEHYRAKAEKARPDQRRHRAMAGVYGHGKQQSGAGSLHCNR